MINMKNKSVIFTFFGGIGLLHFSLTAVTQPVAVTLAATSIGPTNATVNGTVNPNGYAAYAYFQYGLTTNYDSESVIASLPATNAALNVPGLVVTALSGPAGTNWTVTSAPSTNWSTIASSADGTRLATVVSGGGIYTSTNGGGTWTPTSAPVQNWSSIASSDDGMRLAAAVNGGSVYTSTNGGSTWVQTGASATGWDSIACSADGMRLALALYNGTIWTSTNAGSTWTQTSLPATNWYSIASSADGMRLAAVGQNLCSIYTSTDGGASWNSTSVPVGFWDKVISSADGTRLAASMFNGDVYTSTDGGNTWTQTSLPIGAWNGLACSANGMRLAAAIVNVGIYASTDGGVTWTFANAPATTWGCIVSSADGTKLAAVAYGGGGRIYTSTGSLNNLTPDTTYHFRVVGYNSAGTSLGDDLTFTTSLGAPIATTLPASSVTATNATLDGSVLTSDLDTSVYFLYGFTTNYNRQSATNTLAATNITLYVSNLVSLMPLRTYHFQLVASNSLGTTLGGDLTLTTPPLVPAVTTSAATSVGRTNATLHGTVNPNGAVSTAYFQYGLTTNYGSYSPTNTLGASNINLSVNNLLSSLAPGTTYHFQLVAGNSGGTGVGNDLTFATVAGPPTPTTLPASDVTGTNATLNGSLLTGHLATAAYFQYGLTTNYGSYSATNTLASAFVTLSVSNLVSNLAPNKTYHFRLVATNSTGSALGNDLSVVTAMLPAVMTLPATSITASNAALNGTVNPENLLGAAYFQYGLTTNYDNLGGFVALPATNTAQTLPSLMVNALHGPAGANWTSTPAPSASWFSIASSADGTRLAAVVKASGASGGIYTSTNSGVTWTLTSAPITWNTNGSAVFWFSIASSADGMRLAAVLYQGGIYTSTDGGVTWTQSGAPTADYVSIASSADGTRLAAAASPAFAGGIYTSTNGGVTWTQTAAPSAYYRAIACSADGTRLAAVMGGVLGQGIYVSTNAGVTWTQTDASYRYNAVACSADGMRVTVAGDRGVVFISNDGGFSWGYHQPYPVNWNSVASSADGIRLAIAAGNLGIRTSTDGGYTWSGGAELNVTWQGLASSADGSQLAAAAFGGGIITSTGTSGPLTTGTTYHYRAVGLNSVGTGLGNDLTFTIPAAAPTAVTMAASSVTSSNATLNGTINPNGAATTVYFRYGLTTNYGNYSATNTLAATNVTLSVTNLISSLTPGTTYHFELVAGNSAGTNAGADMLFTTLASAVSFNLNGEVVLPGGAFQFGFTNTSGLGFTVLATTNLSLPLTNWTVLGAPVEGPPGHYQFTDPQATNSPTRFYRVRSP